MGLVVKEAEALIVKAKQQIANNTQDGLRYYMQALTLAEADENLALQRDIHLDLCMIHRNLSNMREGFSSGISAANLSQELSDVESLVRAYNFMGIFCFYVGLYKRAMHYFYYGLDNKSAVTSMPLLASIYTNLGETYLAIGNYEQALEALETANNLVKTHEVGVYYTPILCNIGNIYLKKALTEQAEYYLNEAASYQHLTSDSMHSADLAYKMGLLWEMKSDLNQALSYFNLAEAQYRKLAHKYYLIDVLVKKSEIMTDLSFALRIALLEEAKQLAIEAVNQGKLAVIAFKLHEYAVQQADYKTALEHYKCFHEYALKTDAKNLLAKLEIMSIEQDFRSEIGGEIDLQDFSNLEIFGDYNVEATLESLKKDLHYKALTDALTGLPNRRKINEVLSGRTYSATGSTRGILMIDIDFFKSVNDSEGHLFGDRCLKRVSAILRTWQSETNNFVGRYGGEEFLCVLENVEKTQLKNQAETIRNLIEAENIVYHNAGEAKCLTISVGCALLAFNSTQDILYAVEQADRSLYMAKMNGRNCVVLYSDTEEN